MAPIRRAGGGARPRTGCRRSSADAGACLADAKPAKDFTLPTLDGKQLSLSSFKGKVVLLNFWATWCGPCKAEIPGFVELQQQYKNDLVVLGLSVDDPGREGQGVRRSVQGQLSDRARASVATTSRTLTDRSTAFPASFLISRDGKVCKRHLGIAPKAQFEREIKALL